MCIFCGAIPVAAATGVSLNARQLKIQRKADQDRLAQPPARPIAQATAGIVVLLMLGSVLYHSLTIGP